MSRICAGIVTYNPNIDLLKQNIMSIKDQVECIFIVDNGSNNLTDIETIVDNNIVFLVVNSDNMGISKALNQLCENALENKYDWMLTLDQDSISPANLVDILRMHINHEVAIAAPDIVYRNNEVFSEKKQGKEEADWVITSASLTNLKIWKQIGGFDEKLFIDGVDRDFCQRAIKCGYQIIKDYDVQLLHELGNLRCRKVFGRTIYVTNHSPMRKYYMTRNVIYLDKKHNEKRRFSYIAKNMLKTLVYEDKKISKMKSICKGIRDGYRM